MRFQLLQGLLAIGKTCLLIVYYWTVIEDFAIVMKLISKWRHPGSSIAATHMQQFLNNT